MGTLDDSQYPFVTLSPVSHPTINHRIFQFHPDAVNNIFMKCFISWYELKCILDNCDYLGISGSLVMTGNIGTNVDINSQELVSHENKAFFTYRVMGFKNETIPDWPIYENVDKSRRTIIKSNLKIKSNEIITELKIPTETWTAPCPPMWR